MALGKWIEVGRMEELARQDTPVHRRDARALAATTVLFVGCVMSFPRYEVSALMPFLIFPVVLVSLGRIPPGYLARKVFLALPFALLIGLFNPLLDRRPVGMVGSFAVSGGWLSFASILVRFALTVSAALVLVMCAGMHGLCAGLERMGLPRVFAAQLLFLYRYLFVIADEGTRMVRSVQLRANGPRPMRFRTYASLVGHLLLRAMARAERIYGAMAARGFDGEIRVLNHTHWRWADTAFVAGWAAFFAVARIWNLAQGLGAWLAGLAS